MWISLLEVCHRGFFRKEMWAHLPLKYRFVLSPLPGLVCCVYRVFSMDVGGGSVMLPLCTLYSVLYSVYRCILCTLICLLSWRAGDATPMVM